MKTLKTISLTIIIAASYTLNAQVAINTDGSDADASAILDVKSTEKGFLMPRLTQTQITKISNPADGLIVYCTTDGKFYVYVSLSGSWKELAFGLANLTPGAPPCPGTPTVTYAGQTYNTVQIGSQCWMKENLNVGVKINDSQEPSNNSIIEKYCYNDDESYCDTYGGFYQWDELMLYNNVEGAQGICPVGWHIPSDDEIKSLEIFLGMSEDVVDNIMFRGTNQADQMKSTYGWKDNGNGTNSSGFTGLPSGVRWDGGPLGGITMEFDIWSSTEYISGSSTAWSRTFYWDYSSIYRFFSDKKRANNVRCLKD